MVDLEFEFHLAQWAQVDQPFITQTEEVLREEGQQGIDKIQIKQLMTVTPILNTVRVEGSVVSVRMRT